jgi:hypothetical protein
VCRIAPRLAPVAGTDAAASHLTSRSHGKTSERSYSASGALTATALAERIEQKSASLDS